MKKVSVIVPVYNAKDFLAGCLGNLVNQTLSDIEIICVDDASTDASPSILQACKAQFPDKVKVILLSENKGPGNARNAGILASSGDYIGFVDSDDLVSTDMYEKLYVSAKENDADIADCAFFRDSRESALLHISKGLDGRLDEKKKSVLIASGGFCVTKIYRRELLLSNDNELIIPFRESYGLEDMDFLALAIMRAGKASSIEDVCYRYRDGNSVLSKEDDVLRYYHNHYEAMKAFHDRITVLPDYDGVRDAVEYASLALFSNIIRSVIRGKDRLGRDKSLELLNKALSLKKLIVTKNMNDNPFCAEKFDKGAKKEIEEVSKSPENALFMFS